MSTGNLDLAYGSSQISKLVNTFRVTVGSTGYTAGTGGPPTCRLGLYSIAPNGDATLLAQSAAIAAASFAANTDVTAAFDTTGGYPATVDLTYGMRIACSILWLDNGATGHVIPQFHRYESTGPNSTRRGAIFGRAPRMTGRLTGQTANPATIATGSVTDCSTMWSISLINSADSGV
jgi:hypothetical protein